MSCSILGAAEFLHEDNIASKTLSYPAERFDLCSHWMQYFYESRVLFSTFFQPKLLFSL